MATRQRGSIELAPVSPATEAEIAGEMEELDITDAIASEMGNGERDVRWTVNVHRVTGPSRQGFSDAFLFKCDPVEIPVLNERLRDEYGDGLYRIRLLRNGKFHRRWDLAVEAPKRRTDLSAAPQRQIGATSDIQALATVLQERDARLLEMIRDLLPGRNTPAPAVDPFQFMERTVSLVSTMMGARAPVADGTEKIFDAFQRGITLAETLGGGGGGGERETGVMDLIRDAIKQFAPILVDAANRSGFALTPPNNGNGAVIMPDGTQQPPAARIAAPQAPQTGVGSFTLPEFYDNMTPEQMDAAVRQTIHALVKKAKVQAHPGLYAELLYDNLPPLLRAMFHQRPNVLSELAVVIPEITQYRTWFDNLLVEFRRYCDDATADEPGDATNAVNGAAATNPTNQ